MRYRFTLDLGEWETYCPLEQKKIQWNTARALVQANAFWLAARPSTPLLYDAGVRYIAEDRPWELNLWSSIPEVIAQGGSHCVGLTAWRVAELRTRFHEDARPAILEFREMQEGVGELQEFHFIVKRADGSLEDPSRLLGMP